MSETLNTTPSTPFDATEMISSVVSLPEYKRNLEEGNNAVRAFGRTGLELAGMRHSVRPEVEDTFEPDLKDANVDTIRYALIGELPSFIHGVEGIRAYYDTDQVDKRAFTSMKGRAARFNHTVKALIEQDKSLNFSAIETAVVTLYGVMNRDRWADNRAGYEREARWFTNQFDARLRGMQQEVLAHQIIETINDVDPIIDPLTKQKYPRLEINTNVSVEDDLHGTDMYITLDGVTFPIDIKASERTVDNARRKSLHPASIITTGITSLDLKGAFRINTKHARRAAPGMLEKLYAARAEYVAQHPAVSQTHQLAA
ncbi:MAG: hypothetical protein ABIR91_05425 [Candidatus Saccharimonadales bacterium]